MKKQKTVALIGNPNCGKTTLFNSITGARQHVGNWPGVTVEKKEGEFFTKNFSYKLVDLPGIYGFSTNSMDEVVSKNYIMQENPDLIINVVDATTLEKGLQLTIQLLEMRQKVLLILNMWDEVEKRNILIDTPLLSKLLMVPVIPIVAKRPSDKEKLVNAIDDLIEAKPTFMKVMYSNDVEISCDKISAQLDDKLTENRHWVALKLLEGDQGIASKVVTQDHVKQIVENEQNRLHHLYKEDVSFVISDNRFGIIHGILAECITNKGLDKMALTTFLDNILLSKLFGFPIFFFILWFTFFLTFKIGTFFQDLIGDGVQIVSTFLNYTLPTGALQDLLINGIINSVGNILSFLPQIILLFLMIAIMEDTGYMSRVAFLMDKLMHLIGIHGKSFISLFSAFGCNVPGIMASRIVESEDDRKITILINSFMPCSARFAVYVVLAGLFFPKYAYNVVFLMYIIGIAVAIITAKILKKFIFKGNSEPFVMELPPYRIPTLRSILLHMWDKASMFVKKMSTVIVVGTVIVWALGYFPTYSVNTPEIATVKTHIAQTSHLEKKKLELKLQSLEKNARVEHSYLAQIGHGLEPLLQPIGFTWREGVSLISGVVAKEIFISSMIVIYGVSGGDGSLESLKHGLMTLSHMDSLKMFALLVFVTLYIPCIATLAAIRRETNSYKWMFASLFYGVFIAYFCAFLIYQIGSIL